VLGATSEERVIVERLTVRPRFGRWWRNCCIGGRRELEGCQAKARCDHDEFLVITMPWAFASASIRRWLPERASHTRTVRSAPPETITGRPSTAPSAIEAGRPECSPLPGQTRRTPSPHNVHRRTYLQHSRCDIAMLNGYQHHPGVAPPVIAKG
jgi:hypothetical protein